MRNQVALWAGIASFFGSLLAIGAIDLLNPGDRVQFVGGIVVGLITAGSVYAKQRLDDAKEDRVFAGKMVIDVVDGKKIFSLELDKDPHTLEDKSEVVFQVTETDESIRERRAQVRRAKRKAAGE